MRKLIPVLVAAAALSGCYTYGGPYVTKVEGAANDSLSVEKCKIKFNPWLGTFQQSDCATETVKTGGH